MKTNRLTNLRAALSERGLDAIIAYRPENRGYLSGFTGSAGVLVITAAGAYLVTDFRYVEQAKAQAPDFEIVRPESTNHQQVFDLLSAAGAKQVGYESDYMTVDEFHRYSEALEGMELVSAAGLVEGLRTVKDDDEIALMRKAAAIADEAWAQIIPLIKAGVVERDLATELEYRMKKLGADSISFDIIVASGHRSALPHGRASEKVIEQGDLVTFDFGCIYKGYCSDMTRTVMVGEPSAKQREIYEIVLEAEMRGLAACKAGMTGKELDEVCRSYIREKGYAEYFGHGTGHGVGRYIHEGPGVNQRAGSELAVLKPGNVVTIEPGIYLPGFGGVRIEDMVLVTEQGCERLSQSPKDLLIL